MQEQQYNQDSFFHFHVSSPKTQLKLRYLPEVAGVFVGPGNQTWVLNSICILKYYLKIQNTVFSKVF